MFGPTFHTTKIINKLIVLTPPLSNTLQRVTFYIRHNYINNSLVPIRIAEINAAVFKRLCQL